MSTATPNPEWIEIARGPWPLVSELALLLASQFLPYRLDYAEHDYVISVAVEFEAQAQREIDLYKAENPQTPKVTDRLVMPSGDLLYVLMPPFVGTAWGVFAGTYSQWKELGLAHAALIREGEIFRAVTALTLHADSGHLFSNLLAAWGFAFFLQRRMSLGILSLLTLIAGFVANMCEAWIVESHRSLGFSTGTFAMLGFLVALETRSAWIGKGTGLKAWFTPLLGGILLAVLTGVSPEVDVLAHGLGFICGFGLMSCFWRFELSPGKLGTKYLLFSWMLYALNWAIAVYL